MALCLACRQPIAVHLHACPHCQARYGAADWRPLPQSEAEEHQLLGDTTPPAAAAALPPQWRVETQGGAVTLAGGPNAKEIATNVVATSLGALAFVGWSLYSGEAGDDADRLALYIIGGALPLVFCACFLPVILRGRRNWTVAPDGHVLERLRRGKRVIEIGAPVSVMIDPFDRKGRFKPLESRLMRRLPERLRFGREAERRLVLRGPLGEVIVTHEKAGLAYQLRDEMRRQMRALKGAA